MSSHTWFLSFSAGRVYVDLNHPANSTEKAIIRNNPHVQPGGTGRPHKCVARHKVAIILPYRDRQMHLAILLSHLHPILHRQQLDYRIIVVEQVSSSTTSFMYTLVRYKCNPNIDGWSTCILHLVLVLDIRMLEHIRKCWINCSTSVGTMHGQCKLKSKMIW